MNGTENNTCGVGIRGVAMAIDSIVWFFMFFISGFLVAVVTGDVQTIGGTTSADLTGTSALLSFVLWLGLSVGYHVVFEWMFGKTIGKYLVSIKTTHDDGSSLSLWSSVVRNVARLVDILPFFYLVGIGSLIFSNRSKRLGDRMANTVVVRS